MAGARAVPFGPAWYYDWGMIKLGFFLAFAALICNAQNHGPAPKTPAAAQSAKATQQQPALTTAEIAKRVSPSVVVVEGKTDSGDVLGSGFIVSTDGKIITNLHVIRDMKTTKVQLANGEIFDSVSVLAIDERRDLAVVQIPGFNLPVLDLGDSDALAVGESAVIVGSPRGLEGTVTAGILSSVRDTGAGFKVLQTDAAVNPGNSGGPLVNNKGQVIGVVSFKLRSAEGLNFAVPINYVRGMLDNLHKSMTLEQMRKSLATTANPEQQNGGFSLKETLESLRENIRLGTIRYVRRLGDGSVVSSVEQPRVSSLDSCSAAFGRMIIATAADHPEHFRLSATLRYTVPVGLITGTSIARVENSWAGVLSGFANIGEPVGEFVSGDRWSYRVILTSDSKVMSVRTAFSSDDPDETISTDAIYLTFNDESVARRVMELVKHAADLCRSSGATPPSPPTGPSFKETVDWLKEKIPLGIVHYIESGNSTEVSMTEQSSVFKFDSCTGVVGRVVTATVADHPEFGSRIGSVQYTVPTGALTGGSVVRAANVPGTFMRGDRWGYRVIMFSKTGQMSVATLNSGVDNAQVATEAQSTDLFYLTFVDESIAQRVLEAFLHIADLCQKKEMF